MLLNKVVSKLNCPAICFIALVGISAVLTGCSGDQKIDAGYMQTAEATGKERFAIFTRANRDYDKMSPADKATFLKGFNNEAQAKEYWQMMKNPPSSAPVGKPTGQKPGNQ